MDCVGVSKLTCFFGSCVSAKELAEVEYRPEGALINNSLSLIAVKQLSQSRQNATQQHLHRYAFQEQNSTVRKCLVCSGNEVTLHQKQMWF